MSEANEVEIDEDLLPSHWQGKLSRTDLKLIRKAVREGGPIPDEMKEIVTAVLLRNSLQRKDIRGSTAAAHGLVEALEKFKGQPAQGASPNVNVTINQNAMDGGTITGTGELINAASEFARRLSRIGLQPSGDGDLCDQGRIPDAETPGGVE